MFKTPFSGRIVIFGMAMALLGLVGALSCGPKDMGRPAAKIKPNLPYELRAVTRSGGATLWWKIKRRSDIPIRGYNVYLADKPGAAGDLYNSQPYPGDTDGDKSRESVELKGLNNGQTYYASVRVVLPGGKLLQPSETIEFVPLSQGRLEISQNHTSKQGGYSFAKESYTAARDFDNDFYIYATLEKIGISSPSRLHPRLHKTLIKKGSGATKDGQTESTFELTQLLIVGETYMLKTDGGGLAMMKLVRISDEPSGVKAIFDFVYYPPGASPR